MSAGQYKSRITVNRYGKTQSASGGLQSVLVDSWEKWASIENRSGSVQVSSNQKEWSYDYKITLRYSPTQTERSNDFVIYNGIKMLIREVQRVNEGQIRELVLRCSFVEQQTTVETVNAFNMVTWYVADGTEGNTLVMDGTGGTLNLLNKTVTEVNRENEEFKPVASPSDTPDNREFRWTMATRTILFANDLGAGERVKITYR